MINCRSLLIDSSKRFNNNPHQHLNKHLRFFLIAATTAVVAVFMTSCNTPKQVGPKPVSNWAYAPVAIKVHPLSRFAREGNLIVHVKLLDGDGYSCRGVGSLQVNVSTSQNRDLKSNTVRLDDPEVNREHFDNVTRTYRIPLTGITSSEDRISIQVTFTGTDDSPIKSGSYTVVKRKEDDS